MTHWLNTGDIAFERDFASLLSIKRELSVEVDAQVATIVADVRARGDQALFDLTEKYDSVDVSKTGLEFTETEIEAAIGKCAPQTLKALDLAAQRIEAYHARQRPQDDLYEDDQGVTLGHKWTSVAAAGLYVPGGTANYPSSVLMNAIPARVAGVEELVMTVPTPKGVINPLVLAAAKRAGVTRIYRVGGAQAIAALAFGTETIDPVDVIVGPGNAWVAAAKRQVFGQVGIDMIAGPSEILVFADADNNPDWIAADLLSQAEHDVSSQSILITLDEAFGRAVEEAVERQLETLPRAEIARESWQAHGAIIVVRDEAEAVALIDRIAPEHLELAVDAPLDLAGKVRHAGAIFLGRYTPEAIGDYVAGANHVLPTARAARFSSGLSVLNFMKRSSLIGCSAESLGAIGPAALELASEEGLEAHGRSIALRLNKR
ncbi:MAG: histidinol dehydrogenase [Alphaproteobacteria bacterium]|nr:MAG: histidinol dehydrogenase [Alphaproteobacteria bacterium]